MIQSDRILWATLFSYLKFFLGLDMSDQIPSATIVSKWEYQVRLGILFQRLPEGKLHQTKQKSHWSLR